MFASKNVKRMIAFAVAMAIIFVTLFSFTQTSHINFSYAP